MSLFNLGIDVSKTKLDCVLLLPNGKTLHKVCDNTPVGHAHLRTWLDKHGAENIHACMEATNVYWEAIAEFLASHPATLVSVINPAQIKAYGASILVRTKTDKVDAGLIARFCAERCPPAWQPPSSQSL